MGEWSDPMERLIAEALAEAGFLFTAPRDTNLDFRLTASGVEIEVKRFHSPRIADQMARAPNVIAIQGEGAVRWFAALLRVQAPRLRANGGGGEAVHAEADRASSRDEPQ